MMLSRAEDDEGKVEEVHRGEDGGFYRWVANLTRAQRALQSLTSPGRALRDSLDMFLVARYCSRT